MNWEKWVPNSKVTAGTFAAALAFVLVAVFDDPLGLTPAESVAFGGAVTVIVAYLVPHWQHEARDG